MIPVVFVGKNIQAYLFSVTFLICFYLFLFCARVLRKLSAEELCFFMHSFEKTQKTSKNHEKIEKKSKKPIQNRFFSFKTHFLRIF